MTEETNTAAPRDPGVVGVGMPAFIHLDRFGSWVDEAFGTLPYLVGSAAISKTWRDVDVRLILDDDEYARLFPLGGGGADQLWAITCAGLSALAAKMTGLPVDFQIQRRTDANTRFPGTRVPLGMIVRAPDTCDAALALARVRELCTVSMVTGADGTVSDIAQLSPSAVLAASDGYQAVE